MKRVCLNRRAVSRYGIGKGSVIRWLHDHDVQMRWQGPSHEQALEAVRLYEHGLSLSRVGRRLGFDAHTIRRALLAADVTSPMPCASGWRETPSVGLLPSQHRARQVDHVDSHDRGPAGRFRR